MSLPLKVQVIMTSSTELHPIQEKILKRLGYEDEKSFSTIKGDIESNKFSFHLKKLRERNLIEKTEKGYKTTKNGREILPYFDLENSRHPIVVVDLLVFSGDNVYLLPKEEDPLDPFSGDYRAPSTRVSKNNRLKETAKEIFVQEFNSGPEEIEEAAIFDSEVTFSDESKQHYILFFFKTESDEIDENLYELDDLKNLNILPGLDEVIKKIKWNEGFFMGEWDVEQTSDGFNVKKFSI